MTNSPAVELRPCYHPRSCFACDQHGEPCGSHHVGDSGHERCSGRAPGDALTWPGDAPLMFWVHFLLGTTDTFAFVTMNADAAGMEGEELRQALTPATAAALGVPDEVVTVKAWRVAGEPPF